MLKLISSLMNRFHCIGEATWRLAEKKGRTRFWLPGNAAARREFATRDAYTVGFDVYFRSEAAMNDPEVRAHELEHVKQFRRGGLLFEAAYAFHHLTVGYKANPFEVAARRAGRKARKKSR